MGYKATVRASHYERDLRCLASLLLAVSFLSACSTVDYRMHAENFNPRTSLSNELTTVYVQYADDQKPYEMSVKRVPHGYAFLAPIYDNNLDTKVNFTASHTADFKYYFGVRGSLEF